MILLRKTRNHRKKMRMKIKAAVRRAVMKVKVRKRVKNRVAARKVAVKNQVLIPMKMGLIATEARNPKRIKNVTREKKKKKKKKPKYHEQILHKLFVLEVAVQV